MKAEHPTENGPEYGRGYEDCWRRMREHLEQVLIERVPDIAQTAMRVVETRGVTETEAETNNERHWVSQIEAPYLNDLLLWHQTRAREADVQAQRSSNVPDQQVWRARQHVHEEAIRFIRGGTDDGGAC